MNVLELVPKLIEITKKGEEFQDEFKKLKTTLLTLQSCVNNVTLSQINPSLREELETELQETQKLLQKCCAKKNWWSHLRNILPYSDIEKLRDKYGTLMHLIELFNLDVSVRTRSNSSIISENPQPVEPQPTTTSNFPTKSLSRSQLSKPEADQKKIKFDELPTVRENEYDNIATVLPDEEEKKEEPSDEKAFTLELVPTDTIKESCFIDFSWDRREEISASLGRSQIANLNIPTEIIVGVSRAHANITGTRSLKVKPAQQNVMDMGTIYETCPTTEEELNAKIGSGEDSKYTYEFIITALTPAGLFIKSNGKEFKKIPKDTPTILKNEDEVCFSMKKQIPIIVFKFLINQHQNKNYEIEFFYFINQTFSKIMQKEKYRAYFKKIRNSIEENLKNVYDNQININLRQAVSRHINSDTIIGGFYPMKSEPNILPFLKCYSKVAFPTIISRDLKTMQFFLDEPNVALQKNNIGIWEPPITNKQCFPTIILVPFLCFEPKSLKRIGFGGGYYDRYLQNSDLNTLIIGVGYDVQINEDDTIYDSWDKKMNMVVTNTKIYLEKV